MPSDRVVAGPLEARVRECWVQADNYRISGPHPHWTNKPTIHAVVIEWVQVDHPARRQGHFKRFLAHVCADPRFDMVIVEGVQNAHLAEYLMREDWEFDAEVMDFYLDKSKSRHDVAATLTPQQPARNEPA